jgi:hypothetical protein
MIHYQQWIKTSMHYLYITWQEEEEARAVFNPPPGAQDRLSNTHKSGTH